MELPALPVPVAALVQVVEGARVFGVDVLGELVEATGGAEAGGDGTSPPREEAWCGVVRCSVVWCGVV
jgi:hypothetical protein